MNEQLVDIFEEIEEFHWWFEGRRELLKIILGKYLPHKKGKILDVGCGTGGNMAFLTGFGEVWGVDNMPRIIKRCRKLGWKNVKLADALKLPFTKESFGAVTYFDVLEHIEDDAKTLREGKRVLKKGGVIVITVPSSPRIWSAHDELQSHFRRYTQNRIMEIANSAGLEVVEMRQFNFFLWPVIAGVRIMSRYGPFKNLGRYDSKINFDIAKIEAVNKILLSIFKTEIVWGEKMSWPTGVSLLAVLRKPR